MAEKNETAVGVETRDEREARRAAAAATGPVASTEREATVVAQNERAVAALVAPTVDGKTGVVEEDGEVLFVQFSAGEYANTPLAQIPSWYLAHLMADAVDGLKWRQLTKEQQRAVADERDKRAAATKPATQPAPGLVSDLESPQERRAKAAAGIPLSSGAQAPTVGAVASLGSGTGTGTGEDVVPPAVPPPPGTEDGTTADLGDEKEADAKVSVADSTVADAKDIVSKAKTKRELNSMASAENKRDGGPRVGVLTAIENRRGELESE